MSNIQLIYAGIIFTSNFVKVSDWSGWYLGVGANGGLLYNPNEAYFSSMKSYGEYGVNTTVQ